MGSGGSTLQKKNSNSNKDIQRLLVKSDISIEHGVVLDDDDDENDDNKSTSDPNDQEIVALPIVPKSASVSQLIREALKGNFIFESLSPNQLNDLVGIFVPCFYKIGEKIIEQGHKGEYMYVIESGRFEITKKGEGKLGECGNGQAFGELSLLYNAKRSASVTCIQNATLWRLDRKSFKYYRKSNAKQSSKSAYEVLANVPLFKELSTPEHIRIFEVAKRLRFDEGHVILNVGESANTIYIITEGIVICNDRRFVTEKTRRISTSSTPLLPPIDAPTTAASPFTSNHNNGAIRLKAGAWFGENALLQNNIVLQGTIISDSNVEVLSFEREALESVLGNLSNLTERQSHFTMLSNLPIITKLPIERREKAINMFTIESYEEGETIAHCGDVNPRMIVIKTGEACVWKEFVSMKESDETPIETNVLTNIKNNNDNDKVPQVAEGKGKEEGTKNNSEKYSEKQSSNDTKSASSVAEEKDVPPPVSVSISKSEPEGPPPIIMAQVHIPKEIIENQSIRQDFFLQPKKSDNSGGSVDQSLTNNFTLRTLEEGDGEPILNVSTESLFTVQHDSEYRGTLRTRERCVELFDALSSFEINSLNSLSATFDRKEISKREENWRKQLEQRQEDITEEDEIQRSRYEDRMSGDISLPPQGLKNDTGIILNVGDFVGDEPIFDGTPMDCTVVATTDVTCFVLVQTDLINLLFDYNESSSLEQGIHFSKMVSRMFDQDVQPNQRKEEIDWDNLQNIGEIGGGTFGTVYLMEDKIYTAKYALKAIEMKKKKGKESKLLQRIKTEVSILKQMNSPFICKLYTNAIGGGKYLMLLEYIPGGDFKQIIRPSRSQREERLKDKHNTLRGIPQQSAKFYIAALSLPIIYLHRHGIAYRDLKPENIMIDRFGYPKLIDFGLSKRIDETGKTFTVCGTAEYMAPETILGDGHNQAVDWWALGVLLYEMVVGITPFVNRGIPRGQQDQMDIFERTVLGRIDYPEAMDDTCKTLIQSLLYPKPVFRMGCGRRGNKEFEDHDWFCGEMDWVALNMRNLEAPWVPVVKPPV